MKEIKLSQNKITLVDDEDYNYLNQFNWYANERDYTFYALRNKWENGKLEIVFMHREILKLIKGDGKIGDHKDRNGLNNQRYNLRIVSPSVSMLNRKKNKNNTSGYKGVSWNKNAKKWIVHVGFNGKDIYCGLYIDPTEAATVYDKEIFKYHGKDAILNFPLS